VHARGDSFDELQAECAKLAPELADPDFDELVALLSRSRDLILSQLGPRDELLLAIDSVRRNYYLRAQLEDLQREQDQELLDALEFGAAATLTDPNRAELLARFKSA